MILLRLVGTVLVVAVAAAAAYGIGHVTKKDPSDLGPALASRSRSDAGRDVSRPSRPRASTPQHRSERHRSERHRGQRRVHRAATPTVDRSSITVAVINATTVAGLARDASDKLTAAGFTPGTVGNDTTGQAHPGSAVLYAPGNRLAALDVAKVVKIGRGTVRPIDAKARLPAIGPAEVVVMLGTRPAR